MTDIRSRLQSTLGDAYAIERELGGGGMSHVFLATERALGRHVVIKVMPEETAGAVSVERFKREISTAARLQQANIVPVLSAGDFGGVPYFTMPYVTGESLRVRLSSGGEIPIAESVGILKEVARALSYAHSQGVVHRDIKPDNVLLSSGTAMVTDFGVAKALSAATATAGTALTAMGLAIGTPAYMSPEQAMGDPATDHRADIYAFGCLAYELVTGEPPFTGKTAQAIIGAHITDAPPPIGRKRANCPPALSALITQCLAKSPDERPATAAELIAALEQVSTPSAVLTSSHPAARRSLKTAAIGAAIVAAIAVTAVVAIPLMNGSTRGPMTIAVLPFSNETGDTANAYLAQGLSDDLRSMLATATGFNVKARSSSMLAAGKGLREIGTSLGVDAVLQGSLTRSASAARVLWELIRVSDESTIKSGTLDLSSTRSTRARDSLMREIASALNVTAPGSSHLARGTESDDAFEQFLKGEYYRGGYNYSAAIPFLEKAVAIDPNYAQAHASLAIAYASEPLMGGVISKAALPKANASADRAMALAPTLAAPRIAKGLILWFSDMRATEAMAVMREAVRLEPANPEAHTWLAFVEAALGRMDEAQQEVNEATRLDPGDLTALILRQAILMVTNHFREAVDATLPIVAIDSLNAIATANLVEAYLFLGMADSAVAVAERGLAIDPNVFMGRQIAMLAYAAAGTWDKAKEQRRLLKQQQPNSPNFFQAFEHVAFGEYEAAAEAIARGVKAREPSFFTIWVSCEPYYYKLRDQPKFVEAVQSLGAKMCAVADRWPIGKPQ